MKRADTDPDVFLSEIHQTRDELSDLDEIVSTERLTTIILDAFPVERYPTVKLEAIPDLDLSLEQIQPMMRTIFINYSEMLSVTNKNQELDRRGRENGREAAMSTAFINCHYCKKPGHKVRDCKTKLEGEMRWKSQENSIAREVKRGVDTIRPTVIWMKSVSSIGNFRKCKAEKWCSLPGTQQHESFK